MLSLDTIELGELADLLHQQEVGVGYLDPATGTVHHAFEGKVIGEDGEPVDLDGVEWIALGGDIGSPRPFADMEEFAEAVAGADLRRRLQRALGGRGPFRRFRDEMDDAPEAVRSAWSGYRHARDELRAVEWLVDEGVVDEAEARAMAEELRRAAATQLSLAGGRAAPRAILSWPELAERLTGPRSYWLATTNRDGSPQIAPVWGAVVGETLYFYSERSTAKARNVARDPRVAVHLGDAEDVVIVHGRVEDLGLPTDRPDVLAAYRAKYTEPGDLPYLPDADPSFDVLWALRPSSATTWLLASFEDSRRRWRAAPAAGAVSPRRGP